MTNEISTNIEKGIKLLNEALKCYEQGEYSSAYKAYQKAGSFLTEADNRANTSEGQISLKYGGNRNFGVIYKIFESNTKNLLTSISVQDTALPNYTEEYVSVRMKILLSFEGLKTTTIQILGDVSTWLISF